MARFLLNSILIRAVVVILTLTAQGITLTAAAKPRLMSYTKERPLRIVSDWNFAPYEYSNDMGKPEGFNVEVLKTILDEMEVPYVFIMKDRTTVLEMFEKGEADLMVGPFNNIYKFKSKPLFSRKTLAPYKIKIAYRKGTTPVTKLHNIDKDSKVVLKKYDYSTLFVLYREKLDRRMLRFMTPKIALQELKSGEYQYFIWGEISIARMIKELNLSDIELCDIDIPPCNIKFVGHDKQLIDELDERFARLEQSGVIYRLRNKWLHPERNKDDASPLAFIAIIITGVIIITIVTANRMMAARIKKSTQHTLEKNKIMQEALNKSGNYVVRFDLKRERAYNIYGTYLPEGGVTKQQYLENIHEDDREATIAFLKNIIQSKNKTEGQVYRYNTGTKEHPEWQIIHNMSIAETDKNGKAINIISTLTDITTDQANEKRDKELTAKYSRIFEMALIGLSFYDKDGNLINSNKKMREILKYKETKDGFYYNKCLFDFDFIKNGIETAGMREVYFCTKIDIRERGVSEHAEMRIRPIKNDEGELVYILLSARSIEEERKLYQQRKENNDKMLEVNKKIARSENELRYMLNESNMRVWRSSFEKREVTFYKDLRFYDTKIGFDELADSTFSEDDKAVVRKFMEPEQEERTPKTVIITVKDLFTDSGTKHWYSINRIPEYDSNGNMTGYFGLTRDITDLMEAQEKLKEETARANESEQQKSVFLANMSHEIRTPLNAIIGFCDLLQTIDSPDDRKQFARIIHNNCEMLQHLINDILIISTVNTDGLTIEPRPVDLAQAFNDVCTTLAQQASDAGIEFINDNRYETFQTELDIERIQQVIINFTTNAIKHTRQGYIKVGYRIEDNGIRIFCEDTGEGIPKDKCEDVFKRFVKLNDFVQGTGLGLSICKTIADSCGGRIGVESELGKGSYFWMWIPCPTDGAKTSK